MCCKFEVSTFIERNVSVRWTDISGLDHVKQSLEEADIFPPRLSHLQGEGHRPKSFLLFGPVGSGKSFSVAAWASEAPGCTFFRVSSSDLVSRCLTGAENLVRDLFEMAKQRSPSIIFIDDIDLLCSFTKSEQAQKSKAEFIAQTKNVAEGICVISATSVPWLLDAPIRLCFEKRIHIPLPDEPARSGILEIQLNGTNHQLTDQDFRTLGAKTEGFSGADISIVVRDALMQPVRKVQTATHFKRVRGPSRSDPNVIVDDLLTPCSPGDPGAVEMTWMDVDGEKLLEPVVNMNDMLKSIATSKPTVNDEDLQKLRKFAEDFGVDG